MCRVLNGITLHVGICETYLNWDIGTQLFNESQDLSLLHLITLYNKSNST